MSQANKKYNTLCFILEEARNKGFSQIERHQVGDVYRTAFMAYIERHPSSINHFDTKERELQLEITRTHAAAVARQYIKEEIDKWHRRGYK